MCLITRQIKPRIAEWDITVYKKLKITVKLGASRYAYFNGQLIPVHGFSMSAYNRSFRYVFNKLYKVSKLGFTRHGRCLNENTVDAGFHSFRYASDISGAGGVVCKIPKGSLYYEGTNNGETDGYCSNQLIIIKPI